LSLFMGVPGRIHCFVDGLLICVLSPFLIEITYPQANCEFMFHTRSFPNSRGKWKG